MDANSNLSFIKRGIRDHRPYRLQWFSPQNSIGDGHLERIRWADSFSVKPTQIRIAGATVKGEDVWEPRISCME